MSKLAQTVWLVGPGTYDTLPAVARAFQRLGWEVTRSTYQFTSRWQRWLWRFSPRIRWGSPQGLRPWFEARWYNQFLRCHVLPALVANAPRLLVFLRPYRLVPDVQKTLVTLGRPLVTWATDSLTRYGRYAGIWDIAVRNYVFDGGDVRDGLTRWLPLGFDDEVYRPQESREWDVIFVGRVYARIYDRRLHFFQRLVSSDVLSTYHVAWAGSVVRQQQKLKHQFQERGGICLGDLSIPELAQGIARAKIAICVHQDDGHQPVNPMFFAIPGCRTCLVTDRRDYLGRWLTPGQEFVPAEPDDFLDRLKKLLRNEVFRVELAERGFQAARRHTWVERVRTMLEEIQLPPTDSHGREDHGQKSLSDAA